jgi:hypothetical protein
MQYKEFTESHSKDLMEQISSIMETHMIGRTVIVKGKKGKVLKQVGSDGKTESDEIYQVKFEDGTVADIPARDMEMQGDDNKKIGENELEDIVKEARYRPTPVSPGSRYPTKAKKTKNTNVHPGIPGMSKKGKEFLMKYANGLDTTGGPHLNHDNIHNFTHHGVNQTLKATHKHLEDNPHPEDSIQLALIKKELGEKELGESYLYERFGGDANIPANKQTTDLIQSGKAKILNNVKSTLHKNARFVVIQRPLGHKGKLSSNQDKVLMATISDPMKGRIKLFAYHGTHVSVSGAMKFAKQHKLVPSNTMESVEHLDEKIVTGKDGVKRLKGAFHWPSEVIRPSGRRKAKPSQLPRQLKNKKTEMMVSHPKTGAVSVIDKKDWEKHEKQGYGVAESVVKEAKRVRVKTQSGTTERVSPDDLKAAGDVFDRIKRLKLAIADKQHAAYQKKADNK